MSTDIWTQVRAAYIAGEGSLRELAARFGVSESAAESRARRGKWTSERTRAAKAEAESAAGKKRAARAADFERLLGEEETMEALIAQAQLGVLGILRKPAAAGRIEIGREMAYLAQAIETCARVRRDLLEKPDQPERARQRIARAKIRIERERNRLQEQKDGGPKDGQITVNVTGVGDAGEVYGG